MLLVLHIPQSCAPFSMTYECLQVTMQLSQLFAERNKVATITSSGFQCPAERCSHPSQPTMQRCHRARELLPSQLPCSQQTRYVATMHALFNELGEADLCLSNKAVAGCQENPWRTTQLCQWTVVSVLLSFVTEAHAQACGSSVVGCSFPKNFPEACAA